MTSYLLTGGTVATFTKENVPRAFKADVLVEGSTITVIGENLAAPTGAQVINCQGRWIAPGMVDTHRHVWMTVLRAVQCDWLLTEYLVKNTLVVQAQITAEEARIGQLAGCLEALHSGVTTILDHFHVAHTPAHADAVLDATIQSGARVILCPARQSPATRALPAPAWDNDAESVKWQIEKLKEWGARGGGKLSADGRVTLGLAYDVATIGPMEAHREFFKFARSIPVSIITAHVVQGPRIRIYRDGGLLGPDIVFSHCNELYHHTEPDDEMWAMMKDNNCGIASTPVDELGMAHGNPPAFEAVERGVKCGLGIDATSINSGDLFTQMRFALQFWRGRQHEKVLKEGTPPPQYNKFKSVDAFRLGTLGGAECLNMSHLIGTIEVGKKADIVIFDATSANLAGAIDPFQGIVFHASNADVETVFVDGEIVKRDGKLTKVEWGPVAKELQEKAEQLQKKWPAEKLDEIWSEWYATIGGNCSSELLCSNNVDALL